MGLSRRQFTKEFKLAAVRRLEQGYRSRKRRGRWRSTPTCCTGGAGNSVKGRGTCFRATGNRRGSEGRIAELERKVGQQALEIDFLRGCLQRIEERRMLQALSGSGGLRKVQEEMKAERGLTIGRMVELGGVSRAGFYGFDREI
jgi:transposase